MSPASEDQHMFVTGASGLLGANFVASAHGRYRVTACYCRHEFVWPGVQGCAVDLTCADATQAALDRDPPQIIVHFAAATNVDRCEEHPEEAKTMNVEVTSRLAQWAADHGALFVLMSTDSIFDGKQGGYVESDTPRPLNRYAESKLEAEQAVRAILRDHLIVRANIYGWNAQTKSSLAEWALGRLEQGLTVLGFTDALFAPLLVNSLADIILVLLAKGARGTVHAASRDAISKHDFVLAVASLFAFSPHMIIPARMAEAAMKGPRPLNTSLNCDKMRREFGILPPTIREDLIRFKRLRDDGFAERLRAASLFSP